MNLKFCRIAGACVGAYFDGSQTSDQFLKFAIDLARKRVEQEDGDLSDEVVLDEVADHMQQNQNQTLVAEELQIKPENLFIIRSVIDWYSFRPHHQIYAQEMNLVFNFHEFIRLKKNF